MAHPENTPTLQIENESLSSVKVTEQDKDKIIAHLYSKDKCPDYYNDDEHWADEPRG